MIRKLIEKLVGKELKKNKKEKNGTETRIRSYLEKVSNSNAKENKKNPSAGVNLDYSLCIDKITNTIQIEYNKLFGSNDINNIIGSVIYFVYPGRLVKLNSFCLAEGIVIGVVLKEDEINIGNLRLIVKTMDNNGNNIIIKISPTIIANIFFNDRNKNNKYLGGDEIHKRTEKSIESEIIKGDIKAYCDNLCLLDKDNCNICFLNKWKPQIIEP